MQRTLIAVFDKRSDTQSAIDELVSSGFSGPQIRLSEGEPTGGASTIDGIRNFLGTIFGTDDSEHVQNYSDAVTRGHHVLTLTVGNESEVERACAIVERFGPIDIDERAAQWRGGAAAGALAGDAMRINAQQRGSGGVVNVFTHEAATTLNETDAAIEADEAFDAAPGAGGQRGGHQAGQTLNETEAAIEADDAYYLGHYNSNYAASGEQYGHHAPAYRFGAAMAANERYRGRPWTDVNLELQRDWEGGHPGAAWGRFEASVRYGWERGGA